MDRRHGRRRGPLHGHPLREVGGPRRGDREDHDRPPRGQERVSPAHRHRDGPSLPRCPGGHGDRRDRADGRGPGGVLLGWGPARARGLGLSERRRGRQGRGRAVPRDRPARADPPPAQAGRGDGGGLCDRRRARAASRMRSDDRGRERALRAGGTEGRLVRRRVRRGAAGEPGGAQEGQGDLVPMPAVLRAAGTRDGARERGRAARSAGGGDGGLVQGDARPVPLRAAALEGELQRRRGRADRDPAARARRESPLLRQRGGAGGPRCLPGEAQAGLHKVPAAGVSAVRIWVMAARVRTLPAAVAPVLVGTSLALGAGRFHPVTFVAALLGAMFIQVGTNLSNDYSDARRGADTEDRLGPVRVTAGGLVPPSQVLLATYVTFGLAVACGAYLVAVAGPELLAVGAASILAGVLYTGGPRPYGYEGLGEVFVFLFFGIVAVTGSYFVQVQQLPWQAFVCAVPVGLLASAILVVNNVRDLDTDRRAGKRTLAVRLGRERTRALYTAMVAVAFVTAPLPWAFGSMSAWLLLPWAVIPLAARLVRVVRARTDGPALNGALAGTGALQLLFCLLFSAGILASGGFAS